MAKRRRAKSSPPAPGKGGSLRAVAVVLVVGLVAAAGFLVWSQRPPAPVPEPDLSAMEAQVAETIEEARGAVTESPRSADAWGRLGMVFQAHELFSEAADSYAVAFELAPEDARWPYLKAQCHKDLREIEAAREAVASAVRLNPSYAPHFVLAAELEELDNDPGAAVAFYREAIEADASCAPAHFGVGRLVLADDADEAREHLERAAALAPSAGAVQATLARLYRRLGDREAALRSAALARTLHPEVPLDDPVMAAVGNEAESVVGLQTRAVEAEARGDVAGAEALLRRMIALRPDEPNLYYNLGNNLSRQGRLDEAEAQYREALELRPEHVAAKINLGNVHSQRREFARAERLYREVLELEPGHSGALGSLAKIAIAREDLPLAVSLLEEAIDQDPSSADAHYVLAQVLRAGGRVEASVASFERAIGHAPQRGDIRVDLAITFAQLGRYADAWAQVAECERIGWAPPPDFLTALGARMPDPRS